MRVPALCVLTLLTACSTAPSRSPSLDTDELLFGAAAGVPASAPVPVSRDEAFGLDDEMRAFVAANVVGDVPTQRLERLRAAMAARGLGALDYTSDVTLSARATFHGESANCLSFTVLFVALAREAGLHVSYQMVKVPPMWSNATDLVVVRNHVNAIVETPFYSYIVDFNLTDLDDRYERHRISDAYAYALFYNNLAAEALIRKDYDSSFRYLREAITLEPRVTASWSNLGLWYSRRGHDTHAEAAYLRALVSSPRDPTVLTNLASFYATRGNEALAEEYRQRIRVYQQQNPYYHFATARAAYERRDFDAALTAAKRALRLKRDEHEFHFLMGLAYSELGREADAERSFARASAHAPPARRAEYATRLAALARLDAEPNARPPLAASERPE